MASTPRPQQLEGSIAPPGSHDESDFVERLRAGDDDAYDALLDIHGGRLLNVAVRILRDEDEARDCLQEALLSAFQAIETFRGQSKLGTWLHRIVVNTSLSRLRSRNRRNEWLAADLPTDRFDEYGFRRDAFGPQLPTPLEVLQNTEVRTLMRNEIDRLPDGSRIVLLLRDVEELSTAETAALLECTPDAVKVRLHRARLALRSRLEKATG